MFLIVFELGETHEVCSVLMLTRGEVYIAFNIRAFFRRHEKHAKTLQGRSFRLFHVHRELIPGGNQMIF